MPPGCCQPSAGSFPVRGRTSASWTRAVGSRIEVYGEALGTGKSRVYALAAEGLLPNVRLGRRLWPPKRGLEALAMDADRARNRRPLRHDSQAGAGSRVRSFRVDGASGGSRRTPEGAPRSAVWALGLQSGCSAGPVDPGRAPATGLSNLRIEEATGGFEPPIAVLQTAALPLGYVAGGETRILLKDNPWGMARAGRGVYSSPPCQIALLVTA
jgi:hypothetical protein